MAREDEYVASKDTVRVPSADAGPSASVPGGAGTRTGPAPGPPPAAGGGRGLRKRGLALAQRLPSLARRHWLLALLLAAGLMLRVATQIAYRPALFYIDSLRYLYDAHGADPVGYRVLLKPLLLVGNLNLVAVPGWRRRLTQGAILCAAFALPILVYCSVALAVTGHFRLSYAGTNEFYGRLALAVDCQKLALPADERALCPSHARAVQLGIDGLEHNPASPLRRYQAAHPGTFAAAVSGFNRHLLRQDPAAVAAAIGRDALKLFAVKRVTAAGDGPISRWQFQRGYPLYPNPLYASAITEQVVAKAGRQFGGGVPAVAVPLASFLRGYQLGGGYTPGPLLALATLAGLAGTLSLARRHATSAQRDAARACLLTFTSAAAILLISDAFEFSWRYQLPALVTLPPAAALAITALFTHRREAPPQQPATVPAPGGQARPN